MSIFTALRRFSIAAFLAATLIAFLPWSPARNFSSYIKLLIRAEVTDDYRRVLNAPGLLPNSDKTTRLRQEVSRSPSFRFASLAGFAALSTADKVSVILAAMAKHDSTGNCGAYIDPTDLDSGFNTGCCSDYAKIFQAVSLAAGIRTRTVATPNHVFSEYWDQNASTWIFVDTWAGIRARQNRHYLAALDLLRGIDGHTEEFESAGTAKRAHDLIQSFYSHPELYSTLFFRIAPDPFRQSEFEGRFRWLPRSIRQFLGLLTGNLPYTVILTDAVARYTFLCILVKGWIWFAMAGMLFLSHRLGALVLSATRRDAVRWQNPGALIDRSAVSLR